MHRLAICADLAHRTYPETLDKSSSPHRPSRINEPPPRRKRGLPKGKYLGGKNWNSSVVALNRRHGKPIVSGSRRRPDEQA
jgi:hypothetical protein